MPKHKNIKEEITEFLNEWDSKQLCKFLKDIMPLIELYNVDDNDDWLTYSHG